jgi:hypothetical protein
LSRFSLHTEQVVVPVQASPLMICCPRATVCGKGGGRLAFDCHSGLSSVVSLLGSLSMVISRSFAVSSELRCTGLGTIVVGCLGLGANLLEGSLGRIITFACGPSLLGGMTPCSVRSIAPWFRVGLQEETEGGFHVGVILAVVVCVYGPDRIPTGDDGDIVSSCVGMLVPSVPSGSAM